MCVTYVTYHVMSYDTTIRASTDTYLSDEQRSLQHLLSLVSPDSFCPPLSIDS